MPTLARAGHLTPASRAVLTRAICAREPTAASRLFLASLAAPRPRSHAPPMFAIRAAFPHEPRRIIPGAGAGKPDPLRQLSVSLN
jgi:hypothetical protein